MQFIAMASSLAQLGLLVAHEIIGWYRQKINHKEEGPKKDPPLLGHPSFFSLMRSFIVIEILLLSANLVMLVSRLVNYCYELEQVRAEEW